MARLQAKIALITGAGSGIGRAIALAFAREGATLVLTGRTAESLQAAAAAATDLGAAGVVVHPADVTDEHQVGTLFARVAAEFGRLDLLVNNAGAFEAARSTNFRWRPGTASSTQTCAGHSYARAARCG